VVKWTTTIVVVVVVVVVGQEHCHPTWLLSNNYYFAPVPERHTMQMSTTAAAQFCWGAGQRERLQPAASSILVPVHWWSIHTTLTFRLGYPFWTFLLFSSSALLGFSPGDLGFFNRPKLFWQGNYDLNLYKRLFMEIMISMYIYIYMKDCHEENGRNSSNLKNSNRSKSPFFNNKFQ